MTGNCEAGGGDGASGSLRTGPCATKMGKRFESEMQREVGRLMKVKVGNVGDGRRSVARKKRNVEGGREEKRGAAMEGGSHEKGMIRKAEMVYDESLGITARGAG